MHLLFSFVHFTYVCFPDSPDSSLDLTSTSSARTSLFYSGRTQWNNLALKDHDYFLRSKQDKTTQCDEIGYFLLQDDEDALLFTGLALGTFNILVSTLEGYASNSFTMSLRDQVLLTLMKLKTNRVLDDLSKQFYISHTLATEIISYWIDKLEEVLRPLIPWLPRENIRATMPAAFRANFPDTTCIMHCAESLVQKAHCSNSRGSRGESYSQFSPNNTLKYLVAVAPCGLIMFVSAAYGLRCTERLITMDSGILNFIMPGDQVMAERGFDINDLLMKRKAHLVTPSFSKKRRLQTDKIVFVGQTTQVRTHVERAVGCLKVYKILSQVISTAMAPKIDKILQICAALVNLGKNLENREPHCAK